MACNCTTDVADAKSRSSLGLDAQFPRPHHAVCSLVHSLHSLDRAGRALEAFKIPESLDAILLQRLRDRMDVVARLLGETTDAVKFIGLDKDDKFIEIDGRKISLQEASRRLRELRQKLTDVQPRMQPARELETASAGPVAAPALLAAEPTTAAAVAAAVAEVAIAIAKTVAAVAAAVAAAVVAIYGVITLSGAVIEKIEAALNETDDDRARERIFASSPEQIRGIELNELVSMIFAMLDGPTGDDDERAILKILESFDCDGRIRIVNRVGADNLMDNVDGDEWDRLVSLLAECGIINIDQLDDDGSRQFINTHSCATLGQLQLPAVRQLVLNLFSGSCGDDDERAILRLLGCQTAQRLQQLVAMPRVHVSDFDHNVDGSEWDDLEALFHRNGIPT